MMRQEMARLSGRDHKNRTVGIGKIIDAAIARPMHIHKGIRQLSGRHTTLQRIVAAAGGLADIDEIPQHRNLTQNLMIMGRLMGVAPPKGFKRGAIGFINPDKRVIQSHPGNIDTGFHRA